MEILDGGRLLDEWGLDRFKSGPTFGALSDGAIRFLLTHGRVVSLADQERLIESGDAADCFYVVLDGQLDCFREAEGETVPLVVAFGEQVGYVSMIGLFERLGCGRAHGPTKLLQVSSDLFYQLHLDFPFDFGILTLNLSREMARVIRYLTTKLVAAYSGHPII